MSPQEVLLIISGGKTSLYEVLLLAPARSLKLVETFSQEQLNFSFSSTAAPLGPTADYACRKLWISSYSLNSFNKNEKRRA